MGEWSSVSLCSCEGPTDAHAAQEEARDPWKARPKIVFFVSSFRFFVFIFLRRMGIKQINHEIGGGEMEPTQSKPKPYNTYIPHFTCTYIICVVFQYKCICVVPIVHNERLLYAINAVYSKLRARNPFLSRGCKLILRVLFDVLDTAIIASDQHLLLSQE